MDIITEVDVSMYVKSLAEMSLQSTSNFISKNNVWALSITFDGATVLSSSYIDMRVRFHNDVKMCNFHVFSIPIYERKTGGNMFDLISKLLSSICGERWKDKLIGIANEGAANMTGRLSGAVTRIAQECLGEVYRI